MSGEKRRRRNTIAVKMDLIDAVGSVLKKHGFAKLGINLVAEEAKVDKNVIYRNFEDFDKLLEAYVEKQDFWYMALKEHGSEKIEDRRAFMKYILTDQFKALHSSKEFQQLLLWELGDRDDFTTNIAIKREILAEGILNQYRSLLDDYGVKFNFITAIFVSSIYYLTLHKDKSTFCETDLKKKEERNEFIRTIEWLTDLIFDKIEAKNEAERIAINALKEGIDTKTISRITGLSVEKIRTLK
nr:TetR/AcrR family transcriptional regulator [uncultured Draconibacterium sp.]